MTFRIIPPRPGSSGRSEIERERAYCCSKANSPRRIEQTNERKNSCLRETIDMFVLWCLSLELMSLFCSCLFFLFLVALKTQGIETDLSLSPFLFVPPLGPHRRRDGGLQIHRRALEAEAVRCPPIFKASALLGVQTAAWCVSPHPPDAPGQGTTTGLQGEAGTIQSSVVLR